MALSGDLGSIDLANVFQMLLLSQKTGTLSIRSREGRREIWFDGEGVLLPFDRDAWPIRVVRWLERTGVLTAEQVARAEGSVGVVERDLFTILLSMRVLTAEQITTAWRTLMEEEIYELFVDRDATFEFRESEPPTLPGKSIDERYRLSGNSLLMEAARRIDEWSFIRARVPSDRCVLEVAAPAPALPEAECDDAMTAVVGGIDGRSSVTAIVARTGLTRFLVAKKLALLVELRAAYEVPRDALLDRARACLREQAAEQGLALLERALELGADDPAAHEMAALAHQSLGRVGAASRHLTRVADALERAGQRRAAAEACLRIRDLVPTDVRCRERLVQHWIDDRTLFESTRYSGEVEALELAQILRELGRGDALRALLLELLPAFSKNPRLVGKLADLALELGDAKLVVQLLLTGGDALAAAGQTAVAARLYRRVRTVDPQNPGLAQKLRAVEAGGTTRLLRSGVLMRGAALIATAVFCAFGLLAYNREATAAWVALPIEELAVSGDFHGARRELADLRGRFPVSLATLLAARTESELARREASVLDAGSAQRELLRVDSARRQRAAERAFAEAGDALGLGEREAAALLFRRAAEQATDPAFLAERRPAEKAAELEADVAAGDALRADYVAALAAGEWEAMRKAALALLGRGRARPGEPLLLPVRLEIEPADTVIELTPPPAEPVTHRSVVLLPPGSRAVLRVRGPGRYPVERTVVPESDEAIAIRLDRSPDQVRELERAARFAPLHVGGRLFVVCADGRVAAFEVDDLAPVFEVSLPDFDDASGPPRHEADGICVPTRRGGRVWLDPASGSVTRQEATGAGPASDAPEPPRESLELALAGGTRLIVRQSTARQLASDGSPGDTWRLPGVPEWALAAPGAAFLCGGRFIARIVPDRVDAPKSAGEPDR
jgi:hypothetical protein